MFIAMKRILLGMMLFFASYHDTVYSSHVNPSKINKEKRVDLFFQPAKIRPQCSGLSRHFLIVNSAGYYNSVFAQCAENGEFDYFWGWDNGEHTIFTPEMYSFWTALPEHL